MFSFPVTNSSFNCLDAQKDETMNCCWNQHFSRCFFIEQLNKITCWVIKHLRVCKLQLTVGCVWNKIDIWMKRKTSTVNLPGNQVWKNQHLMSLGTNSTLEARFGAKITKKHLNNASQHLHSTFSLTFSHMTNHQTFECHIFSPNN